MTTYKEMFSTFMDESTVTHTINGKEHRFHPISVGLAFKLRAILPKMAKNMAVLFEDTSRDFGSVHRKFEGGESGGGEETIAEAVSVQIAQMRSTQKSTAAEEIFSMLTHENTAGVLAEIIMDSMRDLFPKGQKPPVSEFLATCPLPMIGDMLMGVAKANKEVFGPLTRAAERVGAAARRKIEGSLSSEMTEVVGKISPTRPSGSNG